MASSGGDLSAEIRTTNKIIDWLRKEKIWCVKLHGGPYQEIGLPDIAACVSGIFLGLEVKSPRRKKELTPRQALHLAEIKRSGGVSGVVTTLEEAIELVEQAKRKTQLQS